MIDFQLFIYIIYIFFIIFNFNFYIKSNQKNSEILIKTTDYQYVTRCFILRQARNNSTNIPDKDYCFIR